EQAPGPFVLPRHAERLAPAPDGRRRHTEPVADRVGRLAADRLSQAPADDQSRLALLPAHRPADRPPRKADHRDLTVYLAVEQVPHPAERRAVGAEQQLDALAVGHDSLPPPAAGLFGLLRRHVVTG